MGLYDDFLDEASPANIHRIVTDMKSGAYTSKTTLEMLRLYNMSVESGEYPTHEAFNQSTDAINRHASFMRDLLTKPWIGV
jgi:hypothetical protein